MSLQFLHQSTAKRREMILHGKTANTLLMLALPTIMMSVVQSLLPLSDGLFINNVAGTLVASAVTYSEPVINITTAVAMGLSAAAMALIGQANGTGNYDRVKTMAAQVVVLGFLMGICAGPVLALLAFPISAYVDPEISHNVYLYISLYAFVLPFSFLESIYNAIKNATGHPEATLIRMVIMLILKICFNVVFIVWLGLGIVGCAVSSLCANILICVWMFYELFIHESEDKLTLRGFRWDGYFVKKMFKVGIPSMLTSAMLNLGFFLINNETQKYGAIVLNGQGIASNITSVCFNLPSSFGSAVTTMVSMNIGAGQPGKAKKSCFVGCVASAVAAVFIITVVVNLSTHLTALFTREQQVLDIANHALHIYTYSVVGFGICMVIQGAFIGLGKTRIPLVLGILRIWLLRYIFILFTEQYLLYNSVFWGNLFSNYMAALISIVLILRTRWESVLGE